MQEKLVLSEYSAAASHHESLEVQYDLKLFLKREASLVKGLQFLMAHNDDQREYCKGQHSKDDVLEEAPLVVEIDAYWRKLLMVEER